jgi:hypothetical protein
VANEEILLDNTALAPKKLNRRERKREKWMRLHGKIRKVGSGKKYFGFWATLPLLVLEQIFQYLDLRVCIL